MRRPRSWRCPHDRAGALLEPLLGPNAGHAGGARELADRQPARRLRPAGARRAVRGRRRDAGAVPVRPQRRPPARRRLPVPRRSRSRARQREMQESVDQLRERYLPAMAELLPRARDGEGRALPGDPRTRRDVPRRAGRPPRCARGARTELPGLALAGAWTDTGWPATLESAVLSGGRAARSRWASSGSRRADGRRSAARGRRGRRATPVAVTAVTAVSELLVAAPMRIEAALIASAARGALVHKTGMGPHRSRAAARELDGRAARALLVLGFCGGLDEQLGAGRSDRRRGGLRGARRGPPRGADRAATSRGELRRPADGARAEGARRAASSASRSSRSASAARSCTRGGAIAVDMESVWLGGRGRRAARSGSCGWCWTAPATS